VKDGDELAAMRRASAISDEVFGALSRERFSGRTESELAWWVEQSFREGGAKACRSRRSSAPVQRQRRRTPIPGTRRSSPGSSSSWTPAASSTATAPTARGRSPSARSPTACRIYALCLEAQLAGLGAVAPGVHGRDADAASRTLIEGAGLGWAYGHGMGHGVGLQIHEAPTLRPESDGRARGGKRRLRRAGIYLPDEGPACASRISSS
jgi:Xaa-Pro aminopeptidase